MVIEPVTGLYVHIPFCVRRCAYCSFASVEYTSDLADDYLSALARELEDRAVGLEPDTVFVGGGTPTALSENQVETLFDLLRLACGRSVTEFTVEANPGTLSMDKLICMRRSGVTRISLGVQSFEAKALKMLGRIHTAKEARTAVAMCREAGFDEVSLDFITGWPWQNADLLANDLATAMRLNIPHLSCYPLAYEEGTPLYERAKKGDVTPLDEDAERRIFDETGRILADAGLERYEISNFARPGHECRHNINYWIGGEYVGIGAAAHSYEDGTRSANTDSVRRYIKRILDDESAMDFEERLSPERAARECAVIWLRMTRGIQQDAFRARTGYALDTLYADELPPLIDQGWLEWSTDGQYLRLADKAIPVADSILSDLVD